MSNTATTGPRPASEEDIHIAVICALAHEREAVDAICEQTWDPGELDFDYPGNNLLVGRMGHHFIVLSSVGDTGKISAGILANDIKRKFPRIDIALVVGVCGAMRNNSGNSKDIDMGDVIISTGIIPYDEGKMEHDRFVLKMPMYRPDPVTIRGCVDSLASSEKGLNQVIEMAQNRVHKQLEKDRFSGLRLHQARRPTLHFGFVASGDTVVKNSKDRDMLAERSLQKPIGFEMEGAGVAKVYPNHTVIIKGVSDYADEEKGHGWQPYAAVAAAAYMREFLDKWKPMTTKQRAEEILGIQKLKDIKHDLKEFKQEHHVRDYLLPGRRSRQPSPAPPGSRSRQPSPAPASPNSRAGNPQNHTEGQTRGIMRGNDDLAQGSMNHPEHGRSLVVPAFNSPPELSTKPHTSQPAEPSRRIDNQVPLLSQALRIDSISSRPPLTTRPPYQAVDTSRPDSGVDTSMQHIHDSNHLANPPEVSTPGSTTSNLVESPLAHGKVERTPQSSPPSDNPKKDGVKCGATEIQYPETEALFTACKARDVAKIRELLQKGQSDVSETDEKGKGMLHLTIGTAKVDTDVPLMKKIAEILTMLCEHKAERKANPNLQDIHGHTPIHYCAKSMNSYAIQLLIRYKANINVMDKANCTALNLVVKDRLPNFAFTKWFIERGAKAGTATLIAPRNPNQRQTQVFNAVWHAGKVT